LANIADPALVDDFPVGRALGFDTDTLPEYDSAVNSMRGGSGGEGMV